MTEKAFQDYYPTDFGQCYGCGPFNDHGMKIKSYWAENEEESYCYFTPKPYHTAVPGVVYGGLIASVIDCHATATAAAAGYKSEERKMDSEPPLRYVTASLHVNYLKPTPIDTKLKLTGKVKKIKGRKIIITVTLSVNEEICARGEVVTVQMPDSMISRK